MGKPRVIYSRLGYSTIPSVVTFSAEKVVVGQAAERRLVLAPQETIYGSKRLIGRTYLSGVRNRFQPHFHYKLVPDEDGFVGAEISGQVVSMVDVATHILAELKRNADDRLGTPVTKAVVTVPAYFNDNQRQFVREAGERAGLEVLRTLNEPTAAALCYGLNQGENKRLLVFDLGGGTFDVSIVEMEGNTFNVVGVDGDTFLGGIDFDRRLTDWLHEKISMDMGEELELSPVGLERLRQVARDTKHQLSVRDKHEISIPNLVLLDGSRIDVTQEISRKMFEAMVAELMDRVMSITSRALDRASLRPRDVDSVLLVGGQTRMPEIHQRVRDLFGKEPTKRVHPDEVVALGAAISAHNFRAPDAAVLQDVVPMTIGVANQEGLFMPVIPRNTSVPHEESFDVEVPVGCDIFDLAVFQGDRSHAFDNEFLGSFTVDQLADADTRTVQVKFILDGEGLLTIQIHPGEADTREVTLATRTTPEDVLASMGREKISLSIPQEWTSTKRRSASAQGDTPTPAAPEIQMRAARKDETPPPSPVRSVDPAKPASRYGGSALIEFGEKKPGLIRRILKFIFRF